MLSEFVGASPEAKAAFEVREKAKPLVSSEVPPWWGLNDVVGWIDVRLDVRAAKLDAALFLPKKRISRQLRNKVYWPEKCLSVPLGIEPTNDTLRRQSVELVELLLKAPRTRKLYTDLASWRRQVVHTDLIGLARDATVVEPTRHCS